MNQTISPRELSPSSEMHEAFERFQERQHRNYRLRQETLTTLASILAQPTASTMISETSPLLRAASAVGEKLKVTIRPPATMSNLNRVSESLEDIAQASHLRVRRVRLTAEWWHRDGGPLLAYTREDHHPVALLPISSARYELFDPSTGRQESINAQVSSRLEPEAYTFCRPFPEKALHWFDLLKFGIQGYPSDLMAILLTGIAVTLLGMFAPQAVGFLIDHAIPDADRSLVLQLGTALFAVAFGQALFQISQGFALLRQHIVVGASLQAAMWDRLLKLKASFFRQYSSGDLQARVTAISAMQHQLSGSTLRTLFTSTLTLLNLILMCYYSLSLALVAVGIAMIVSITTAFAGKLTVRHMRLFQDLTGELLGTAVQLIHGIAKLRVAGAEERAFAHWGMHYGQQQMLQRRIQCIEDWMTVINGVLPTFALVALFWGAMQTLQTPGMTDSRDLTAGTFLAFHAAFSIFIGGATSFSNTLIELLDVTTLWKRAKPVVEAALEVNCMQVDPGRLTGCLSVEHVTFRYQEHESIVLDDVSIHAEPGEFIAIVGPSGSGKSTLFRLLLGLDAPKSGIVSYNSQDFASSVQ